LGSAHLVAAVLTIVAASGSSGSSAGISLLNPDSDSHQHEAVRKRKFEPERESKALPKLPQLASSASGGHAVPKMPCFQSIQPKKISLTGVRGASS